MRILYGVCGEGFGHSSRAKEIINYLKSKNHKVLVLTYGQAYQILKPITQTIKVHGIHLTFKKNKLSLPKTITSNITALAKNLKNFREVKSKINSFKPQLCISDMEPFVPIISHWRRIPLISIDNQHRLTHLNLKIPKKYKKDYLIAKLAVNACVSRANAFIILSFTKSKKEKSKSNNSFIVSPILRKEIIKIKPKIKNHVLVYLTKPNPSLLKILKTIPKKFVIYSSDFAKKDKNLEFKKQNKTNSNFLKDLSECRAIIASAGFTLISESLYLKKPYFAIPLQGQFEQTLNALFLKNSGLGVYSENPTKNQIQEFLSSLDKYKSKLKSHKLKPNEAIQTLDKILKNTKIQNL